LLLAKLSASGNGINDGAFGVRRFDSVAFFADMETILLIES